MPKSASALRTFLISEHPCPTYSVQLNNCPHGKKHLTQIHTAQRSQDWDRLGEWSVVCTGTKPRCPTAVISTPTPAISQRLQLRIREFKASQLALPSPSMKTRSKRAKKDTTLKAALDSVENAFATILPDGEPVNELLDNEIERAKEAIEELTVLLTPRGKGKAKSKSNVAQPKKKLLARVPTHSEVHAKLGTAAPFPKLNPLAHETTASDSDESIESSTESLRSVNGGDIPCEHDIAFQDNSLGKRDRKDEIRVIAHFWTNANQKPVKRELHIRFKTYFDLTTFPVASKVKLVVKTGTNAVVFEHYSFADLKWKGDAMQPHNLVDYQNHNAILYRVRGLSDIQCPGLRALLPAPPLQYHQNAEAGPSRQNAQLGSSRLKRRRSSDSDIDELPSASELEGHPLNKKEKGYLSARKKRREGKDGVNASSAIEVSDSDY